MSQETVKVVIRQLKDELVKWVLAKLVAKASFLAWGPVNALAAWLIAFAIDELYDKGAFGLNWVWAIVENKAELKDAIKTRDKLQALLNAGHDYTEAEKEFDEATDDLIKNKHKRLPRF